MPASEVPRHTRVYQHTWADKPGKAKLTVADLKKYAWAELDDIIHYPTPTPLTNNSLEANAALHRYPMWS